MSLTKELEKLAEKWMIEQEKYPKYGNGSVASAAVRCCARELREVLDREGAGPTRTRSQSRRMAIQQGAKNDR